MFGDAWSNPLVFSFDAQNKSSTFIDAYLDLDGAFHECYFPISVHVKNSHFNLTNYQYGIWTDFRWDCYANNATTLAASIIVEGTLFTDPHEQALYNFLYISTFDDFILRNNTFNNCTYLDMQTRPFLDVHPQLMCDPDFRTQHVFIDGNTFINLNGSSLMFTVNYMTNFNGTKIFSMQNNTFVNSSINTQFMAYQIQNPSPVTVANNYYNNVTVLSGFQVFYFFSAASNITITNETLVNNVLDDLYTIGAANSIKVKDFSVTGNMGTGSITETSAILRISSATALCSIKNFSVSNSSFMYGMAIEVEQAGKLVFSDSSFSTNSLQNQDFITLNQVTQAKISNLVFNTFQKISDKSRFAISMPTLTLSPGTSSYQIANITFSNSQASFLSVSQVQVA